MPAAFHANVIFEVGGGVVVEGVEFGWSSLVMFFEGLAERCSDLREAELASAGTSGSRELSGDHLQSSTPPRIVAMDHAHASCRREKTGFLSVNRLNL